MLQLKSDQVRDEILRRIEQGAMPPGTRLPGERDLARELGVNTRTVRRGLRELVKAGVIVKRPRVGNFTNGGTPQEIGNRIALILPDWMLHTSTRHPLVPLIYRGIGRVLSQDDFSISAHWFRPPQFANDIARVIAAQGIRAALLFPSPSPTFPAGVKQLIDSGVKVACIQHAPSLEPLGLFGVEMYPVGVLQLILDGLIERGHRRIVVSEYVPSLMATLVQPILQSLADKHGLGDPQKLFLPIPSDGYHAQNEVLATLFYAAERPTAVVVPDESVALSLFRVCYERGISVPKDVSIAAQVDNTPEAHPVALTAPDSVNLCIRSAQLAAEHLFKMIKGEEMPICKVNFRCEVQWKQSVVALT